jgi:putative methionine-R-sulfoxide reductase with GAF domain
MRSVFMEISWLNKLLDDERLNLGATSCTLYVPDTYWDGEYRLVSMPGVKIREPMYGFGFPASSRRLICEGDPEVFESGRSAAAFCGVEPPAPQGVHEEHRMLFGGFGEREGVAAFARLFHPGPDGKPGAVLFVNFGHDVSFGNRLQDQIRSILNNTIVPHLGDITSELRRLDARPLAEAMKILHPAQALATAFANADPSGSEDRLQDQFTEILKLSLSALGIDPTEGLGTVHLYEPEAAILKLAAHYGNVSDLTAASVQAVDRGNGIASWVVLRQRAILINDLTGSLFQGIQVVINKDVQSELAVPMVANGELVGVLNLESTRKDAFSSASVRSLWYAANSAAVAFQMAKSSSITRMLLDICATAARDREGRASLKKIAKVLCFALDADFCDIWPYNPQLHRFDAAGSSPIRSNGWSAYIREAPHPVWLSDIIDENHFSCKVWTGTAWLDAPNPESLPSSVNKKAMEIGVKAQLGMPITVSGEFAGVAWIKYKRGRLPPGPERMRDAFSYVSQARLVLDAVQWRLVMPSQFDLDAIGGSKLKAWSETGPLHFGSLDSFLDGYVVHRSFHAHVCGDFHAIKAVQGSVVGLLIGDAAGKAVPGLLNALPLMTGFEIYGGDSSSARHPMEKLMDVANTLGVSGTGLYCTFTLFQDKVETGIRNKLLLSVTSAGHPSLILLRRSETELLNQLIPGLQSPAKGALFGYPLRRPLSEDPLMLEPGDTLVAYTDGVGQALTAHSEKEHDWAERIIQLATVPAGTCQEVAEAIVSAAEKAGPLHDDMTVWVVRMSSPWGS